jgi:xylan 1,4-beta-xylosidase
MIALRLVSFSATLLACLAVLSSGAAASAAFPVTITVDAAQTRGEVRSIWRFFGADEPNCATMKNGTKSMMELGELPPHAVCFRAHNLLCTGDGTPAFALPRQAVSLLVLELTK